MSKYRTAMIINANSHEEAENTFRELRRAIKEKLYTDLQDGEVFPVEFEDITLEGVE